MGINTTTIMKKTLLNFIFFLVSTSGFTQKISGEIVYEKVGYWSRIYTRANYLTQEEKDREKQTWKNDDEFKSKMKLSFTESESEYTYANDQGESEDGNYTWRQDEYIVKRNFNDQTLTELHEMLGKNYLVKDSLQTTNWRIMNEVKEVANYICMKAVCKDTIKDQNITAWFATDLPVSAGPERYYGLPGIILEISVNDGDVTYIAQKIDLKPLTIQSKMPKKIKAKTIDLAQYNKLIYDYIQDSMKAHRYPWAVRY